MLSTLTLQEVGTGGKNDREEGKVKEEEEK